MKKLFIGLSLAFLLIIALNQTVWAAEDETENLDQSDETAITEPDAPASSALPLTLNVDAAAAILIDAESGQVLYAHNEHQSLPMASTTKILTAMLTLEHFSDLKQTFTLPEDFANVGESSIWLEPGETHTIEDLLYATMLRSANDAAQSLAMAVAGTEQEFAALMNARTAELGLSDSNWTNPHGLHDDEHYSSAYDLAFITREAIKNPMFNTLISADGYTMPWQDNEYDRTFFNHNNLLQQYSGADGVKTGYTNPAGSCLVGAATRNGMRLIGVVLNSEDMYTDMSAMLDFGFDNYSLQTVALFGEIATKIPVVNGQGDMINALYGNDVKILTPIDTEYLGEPSFDIPDKISTPILKDQIIGRATFDNGQGILTHIDLLAAEEMERYTFWGVVQAAFYSIMQVLL